MEQKVHGNYSTIDTDKFFIEFEGKTRSMKIQFKTRTI